MNINLQSFIKEILNNYKQEKNNDFANNSLGSLLKNSITDYLKNIIDNSKYTLEWSIGKGQWAAIPWLAIFDNDITKSAQNGYYIVYLFKENMSGVYVTIMQGTTSVKQEFGKKVEDELIARSKYYSSHIMSKPQNFNTGEICLNITKKQSAGYLYQYGTILHKYYDKNNVPDEKILIQDLKTLLNIYNELKNKNIDIPFENQEEDEQEYIGKETSNIKYHKHKERNQKLSQEAKKLHGYKCHACGFKFTDKYKIPNDYIEAHHLTPLSKLDKEVQLNVKNDFAVLCSNCHSAIHLVKHEGSIKEFIDKYIIK